MLVEISGHGAASAFSKLGEPSVINKSGVVTPRAARSSSRAREKDYEKPRRGRQLTIAKMRFRILLLRNSRFAGRQNRLCKKNLLRSPVHPSV
jgi:hypothetical protein